MALEIRGNVLYNAKCYVLSLFVDFSSEMNWSKNPTLLTAYRKMNFFTHILGEYR